MPVLEIKGWYNMSISQHSGIAFSSWAVFAFQDRDMGKLENAD